MMFNLSNFVLPPWAKYATAVALVAVVWGHGYVKGIERTNDRIAVADTKIIYKQGKVTTKVITKYVKVKEKQEKVEEQIKNEGQSYAIKFPDNYNFNNEYVRLFNMSVTGEVSTLPKGTGGEASGVTPATQLDVSIHNHKVARDWKRVAETCEAWVKEQEELNGE
jgi:hypothetical protein